MSDEEENILDRPREFRLARIAHGERNVMGTATEMQMQAKAREKREVLLPGVDLATAWAVERGANKKAHGKVCRAEPMDERSESGLAYLETGWALFFRETWRDMHHLVRYFDLIEKNEAPDTSLLEWLVAARVVPAEVARACAKKFRKEDPPLCEEDAMRIEISAEAADDIEREAKARQN